MHDVGCMMYHSCLINPVPLKVFFVPGYLCVGNSLLPFSRSMGFISSYLIHESEGKASWQALSV